MAPTLPSKTPKPYVPKETRPSQRYNEVIYTKEAHSTPINQVVSYEKGKRIVHSQSYPVYKGDYTYTVHLDENGYIVKVDELFCPEVEMSDATPTRLIGVQKALSRAQRRLAK